MSTGSLDSKIHKINETVTHIHRGVETGMLFASTVNTIDADGFVYVHTYSGVQYPEYLLYAYIRRTDDASSMDGPDLNSFKCSLIHVTVHILKNIYRLH